MEIKYKEDNGHLSRELKRGDIVEALFTNHEKLEGEILMVVGEHGFDNCFVRLGTGEIITSYLPEGRYRLLDAEIIVTAKNNR